MTFAARHPGKCSACGDLFPEGTAIRRDQSGRCRHANCDDPDAPAEPIVARDVCPNCWLERSVTGACGCEE